MNRDRLVNDAELRHATLVRLGKLVEELKGFASRVSRADELLWIRGLATNLQLSCTGALAIDDDLREEILEKTPRDIRMVLAPSRWCKEEIEERLSNIASNISRSRKLRTIMDELSQAYCNPSRLDDLRPSSKGDELADWRAAETVLACDVLEGRVPFIGHFSSETYPYLETVWLEDVQETAAYRLWESESSQWDPDGAHSRYLRACSALWARSCDHRVKADLVSFIPIRSYLEAKYLSAGGECESSKPDSAAYQLVSGKAKRIWERRSYGSPVDDWLAAERYVRSFYQHIVAAIVGHDERLYSPDRGCGEGGT